MRIVTTRLAAVAIALPTMGGIVMVAAVAPAHAAPLAAVSAAPLGADLADLNDEAAALKDKAKAANEKLDKAVAALGKAEDALAKAKKRREAAEKNVASADSDVESALNELRMVQFGANLARALERRAEEDKESSDDHGLLGLTSATDLAAQEPSLVNLSLEASTAEREATINAIQADWAGVGARTELRYARRAAKAAATKRDEAAKAREKVESAASEVRKQLKDAEAEVAEAEEQKRAEERRRAAEKAARDATRIVKPGTGHTTSPYGMRTHPITGVYKLHSGTDFSYGDGTAYTARMGTVAAITYDGAYGNMVTISHGGGIQTRYAHLASVNVGTGQKVSAGTVVGQIGSTGYSTGPHLHFEVLKNGQFVNADSWLGQ